MRSTRILRKVTVMAAACTVAFACGGPAHAGADVRSEGLSGREAPYYLDVRAGLPPQFRQLSDTEMQELGVEALPEVQSAAYVDDDSGVALVLNLKVGHGRSSQLSFREHVAHVDRSYTPDDFAGFVADTDLPADQVSVTSSDWSDVQAGDAARSALFSIDVAGETTAHVEMLVMAVSRGDDAALVQVMQIFGLSPEADSAEIARAIAARVDDGPPSAAEAIAAAGLITGADLPNGWEADPSQSTSDPTSSQPSSGPSSVSDGTAQVRRIARRLPQCKTFVEVLDAAGDDSRARAATPDVDHAAQDGEHFVLGAAKVTSQVTVYPSAEVAERVFAFVRDPSVKQCLSKLYSSVVDTAARTAARNGHRTLTPSIVVTTPRTSTVGDDRMLFRITVEVEELPGTRFLFEAQFVLAGRAVAVYTFSTAVADTIREAVVPTVTARLAGAQ